MRRKSEEYKARAKECAEIARMMSSADGKREFEKLARGWGRMAERAEKDDGENIPSRMGGRYSQDSTTRAK
jgi:hypothetical protein